MKKNIIAASVIALSLALTACGGSAEEQAERAETNQAWADEKYDSLLENYGVKSQSELLTQNSLISCRPSPLRPGLLCLLRSSPKQT